MRDTVMRDIDTAFLAVGGSEFNKARCQCDHDVGHFPCEYCAIRDALCVCRREITRLRAEIALLRLTDAEREALERLCEAVVEYAADDRQTNGETFAAGDEHAVTVVRAFLARLGGDA